MMPKSDMSDDQIKQLLAQIRDWMSKSDQEAAEQVAMKQGGKIKKHAKKPKTQRKPRKPRDAFGNGGYMGDSRSVGGGGGGTYSPTVSRVMAPVSNAIGGMFGSQAPSQQSGYLGSISDAMSRAGFRNPDYAGPNYSSTIGKGGDGGARGLARAAQVAAPQANLPSVRLPAMPDYVNYQTVPQQWSQAPVMPSQAIANFNNSQGVGIASPAPMMGGNVPPLQNPNASQFYGQPRAHGGRTDSVTNALRVIKSKHL